MLRVALARMLSTEAFGTANAAAGATTRGYVAAVASDRVARSASTSGASAPTPAPQQQRSCSVCADDAADGRCSSPHLALAGSYDRSTKRGKLFIGSFGLARPRRSRRQRGSVGGGIIGGGGGGGGGSDPFAGVPGPRRPSPLAPPPYDLGAPA